MSVFKVQLQNTGQGLLDRIYSVPDTGGTQQTLSIQRTAFVMGPNKTNRLLKDGDTFTDCNYWKRFAYPQVPLEQAIVTILTDDGSVYSDFSNENTSLKSYALTIANSTTYTTSGNLADILGDTGGYAVFTQITNNGTGVVSVKVNGATASIFTLGANETVGFNAGELAVTSVAFANSSGSSQAIQILAGVRQNCAS